MKRFMMAISAVAALLGGAIVFAPAAMAASPIQTITKGGVTCSQWSTGYSTFPTTYWDCVNPAAPTAAEHGIYTGAYDVATSMPSVVSTLSNVQIYAFKNAADYNAFTGTSSPAPNNALAAASTGTGGNIAAAFGAYTYNGTPNTDASSSYQGDIAQALGQYYGIATTSGNGINSTAFKTAWSYDQNYLTYLAPSQAFPTVYQNFPGLTSLQILTNLYGNSTTFLYGLSFMHLASLHTVAPLDYLAQDDLPTGSGWEQNYVKGPLTSPALVYTSSQYAVMCVPYVEHGTFPTKYYNCIQPYAQTTGETNVISAINHLPSTFQTKLTNANVAVFEMWNIQSFDTFFSTTLTPLSGNVYGVSVESNLPWPAQPGTSTPVSAVFSSGDYTWEQAGQMSASIIHELGHQIDQIYGNPSTTSTSWNTAYQADEAYLKTRPCSDYFSSATCTKYSNQNAWIVLGLKYSNASTEVWAYVFEKQSTVNDPLNPELVNIEAAMTHCLGVMNTFWTTGVKPN